MSDIAAINKDLRIGVIASAPGDEPDVVDVHVRDDHGIDRCRTDADCAKRLGKAPRCFAHRSCRPSIDEDETLAVTNEPDGEAGADAG